MSLHEYLLAVLGSHQENDTAVPLVQSEVLLNVNSTLKPAHLDPKCSYEDKPGFVWQKY